MHNYYQLIASLPHLPRFDRAEVLPISRERLLDRLKMLKPEDYAQADKAAAFLAWRRQSIGQTDQALHIFSSPLLRELFAFPIDVRTLIAALRRKEMGMPKPAVNEVWGVGDLVKHIEQNWDDPYFKLATRYPWIVEAKNYLHTGDSLKLEHLLKTVTWDKLDRLLLKNNFGFEAVIAYLLKWDITQQWLAYKKEGAVKRFEELIMEVMHA